MNTFEEQFNHKMKEARKIDPDTSVDLTTLEKRGGNWLACARTWIQHKAINGDTVIWGSQDLLKLKPLFVWDIEDFATRIAQAAVKDLVDSIKQYGLKGFQKIEPEDFYKLQNAERELQKTKKILACYQQAVNEIDDYFEYTNESAKDKNRVMHTINRLTTALKAMQK